MIGSQKAAPLPRGAGAGGAAAREVGPPATPGAPPAGAARRALQAAVGPWHARLEAAMDLPASIATRHDLVPVLAALLPVHLAVEGAWRRPPAGVGAWPRDWSLASRHKSDHLRADLTALGLSDRAVAALPRLGPRHSWRTLAGMAGCLWVVEGSTLGGLHLARTLGRRVGLRPDNGGSFFVAYGRRTGHMWRTWLAALEAALPSPEAREEAGAAAQDTFALFYEQLVAAPPRPRRTPPEAAGPSKVPI